MKRNVLEITRLLVLAIFSLSLLTGCSNNAESNSTGTNPNSTGTNPNSNESSSGNQSESYTSSELEKHITSSGAITERGKLVVFVKNDNDVAIDIEIEVEFYDAENVIVGSDSDSWHAIGNNSEIATEMWNTPENFDNYKIYVDVEQTEETSYYDQLEVTHNNNGEEIVVQVKNNSQDVIEYINVSVVYYQGDKVVGIDDSSDSDIKSGRSANFNLMFPYDKKYNDVNFDNYKVFVNEACSYNW